MFGTSDLLQRKKNTHVLQSRQYKIKRWGIPGFGRRGGGRIGNYILKHKISY